MKYYCIGIKGSGMSTLAQILYDLGNEVSGYDDTIEEKYTEAGLKKRNIPIYHEAHPLDKDTIVTYSAAFREDHKEIQRVKELGLTIRPYNELLGDLTEMFETTCVCGTHGKTTTSLLISHILTNTLGCNYFVGDGSGYASGDNRLFVIESCEYKRHFLSYHPTNVIVTNIELEHTECYNGIEDIIRTFQAFTNKRSKLAILCGDDENIRKMDIDGEKIFYGFANENDYQAKNVVLSQSGSEFDCYIKGEFFGHFDVPLFGKHMVLNALAAIALCHFYGLSFEEIHQHMETFQGAKRRFKESVYGDIVVIDDYAHHPTELKVTLEAAHQKYPDKELIAVFLPNTYSRTLALLDDFIRVLKMADTAYVMDIHCDRERAEDYENISSDAILKGLPNGHKLGMENIDDLLKHKNAVICFMSCTNIYLLEDAYVQKISQNNK